MRNELGIDGEFLNFGNRIVIPTNLRESILEEMHKTHLGMVKMMSLIRSYVWWPGITNDVEGMVNKCESCYLVRAEPNTNSIKY